MDASIITYQIYENGSKYLGHAKVTLPDVAYKTATINGAGVAGDVNVPLIGQFEAMTCKIEFTDNPKSAYILARPGKHLVDCRAAHQTYNEVTGEAEVHAYKHVLELMPTTRTGGTIAPATPQGAAVDFVCLSCKDYIDGKLVSEKDPVRSKDIGVDGVDNLAQIKAALGE